MEFIPPGVEFYGHKGYYHGAQLMVITVDKYPYIYASGSQTGGLSYKGTASNGMCIIDVAADTSSTSKTVYIIASDTPGLSGDYSASNNIRYAYNVPRFAFKLYYGSSKSYVVADSLGAGTIVVGDYGVERPDNITGICFGFSTQSNWPASGNVIDYVDYGTMYWQSGPDWNGSTFYACFATSDEMTYYCGSNSAYSQELDYYIYGTGQKTDFELTEPDPNTCESDDSYAFHGWTSSKTSTEKEYDTLLDALNAGNTTVYGIYKKELQSTTNQITYYKGSRFGFPATYTTTIPVSYYYGKGYYEEDGTVECVCNNINAEIDDWTLLGFTTDPTVQSSTSTAEDLCLDGATILYGTYIKEDSITCYPQNGDSSNIVSITNYKYGTGDVTSNIPDEPDIQKDGYQLAGWAASSTTNTYGEWTDLWNSGTDTVYAVWKMGGGIWHGVNGQWKPLKLYYGTDNDIWSVLSIKYGDGTVWKKV